MEKILVIIDIDKWAFAKIANAIQQYSTLFEVDIERMSKIYKKKLDEYGLVFSLIDFRPLQHIENNFDPKKLIIGIRSDVFFKQKEFYENKEQVNKLCRAYICSNKILYDKFISRGHKAWLWEGGVDEALFRPKPNDGLHNPVRVSWVGSRDHFTKFRNFNLIQKACNLCGAEYYPAYREIKFRTEQEMAEFHRNEYDIYCDVDLRSGRANGLVEAMSSGKLCMAVSGAGVNNELIRHKQNGLLIQPTVRQILRGIKHLIGYPEYRTAARHTILKEWTWKIHVQKIERIFKEILDA